MGLTRCYKTEVFLHLLNVKPETHRSRLYTAEPDTRGSPHCYWYV